MSGAGDRSAYRRCHHVNPHQPPSGCYPVSCAQKEGHEGRHSCYTHPHDINHTAYSLWDSADSGPTTKETT